MLFESPYQGEYTGPILDTDCSMSVGGKLSCFHETDKKYYYANNKVEFANQFLPTFMNHVQEELAKNSGGQFVDSEYFSCKTDEWKKIDKSALSTVVIADSWYPPSDNPCS